MAKKRKNVMKRNSLTRKIVSLTVFLDALFLVLLLSGTVFLYYFNLHRTTVENAQYQNQIAITSFDDIIDTIKSDGSKLAVDSDITNYLNYINTHTNPILDEGDEDYDIYADYLIQAESVKNYQNLGLYDQVFVASENNCSTGTEGCGVTHEGLLSSVDWKLTERTWYVELGSNDYVVTTPYIDDISGEYVISYVEKVYDGDTVIGYVGIDVLLTSLASQINAIHTDELNDENEIIVFSNINDSSRLIYFSDDSYTDYLMMDNRQFTTIDQQNGFGSAGIGFVVDQYTLEDTIIEKAFGSQFVMTYSDIQDTDFTVVTLFYYNQIFRIEYTFIISLFFAGLMIVLIGVIMTKTTNKSLSPIDDILESIEEIKNGNYKIYVDIKENNEFKKIGDAINIMSEEIDNQVKRTYESLAYDLLTGLKNRASASKEVDSTIFKSNNRSAVCLIQVDNLKNINVTKGQMIGDNLIKAIAQELKLVLQTGETLFSNGGNEFVYIKENIQSLEQVEYALNRLLTHFKEPLVVKNIKTEVKFFIGVSVYPTDGNTLDELIKKCDTALFKASESSMKKIIFYNDKIARSVSYQAEVSEQLSQAIQKQQIYLKYQPLITNRNEIYGFEALARWNSPSLGEIGPQVFIANAEESYLIIPIGTWILKEACKAQVSLREKYGEEYMMSVNVSPVQILQKDFVDVVKNIIRETDITAEYLTLEITESVFIEASVLLEDTIERLHSLGVKLSLDDFGTGYASLTYLRQINFDNLKIDKSFVDGIYGGTKDHRIVGTIVNLVHNLDMKVIAEGVETRKQYEYLKQISTDVFQGYIFSKPLRMEDLQHFIDQFYKVPKSKRADVFASLHENEVK